MASRRGAAALAGVLITLVVSPASAKVTTCALPDRLPIPKLAGSSRDEPRRVIATGGYTLALSWSPQQCAKPREFGSFQCDTTRNRFGFILHGLWPDGWGREWPQYCRPATRLPTQLLRTNLCATPSVDLLQHEWAKHGTCMAQSPKDYFDRARQLHGRLRFPDMAKLAQRNGLTVAIFTRALLDANDHLAPGLSARAIRVRLSRDGWLDEVWLCLDREQRFATCRTTQSGGARPERRFRIRTVS